MYSTEVTLHKIAGPAVRDPTKGRMAGSDARAQVADRAGEEQEASPGPLQSQADCRKIGECKFHRPVVRKGRLDLLGTG